MGQKTLIWLQAGSCGGCTLSGLGAEGQGFLASLEAFGIDVLWHPSLSLESGDEALGLLKAVETGQQPLDILCVEGSILTGPNGTGAFQTFGGEGRSMMDWVRSLAQRAEYTVAVGSCSSFGGIHAIGYNETDAVGLQYSGKRRAGCLPPDYQSKAGMPVINVAGCAPHPGWIVETLAAIAMGDMDRAQLDRYHRPLFFAEHLAHHGCARNEYYEFKASALKSSDLGCLMENLGCKATQAAGDCNMRSWNGGGACTNAGYTCVACTEPGFEDDTSGFLTTAKLAGIPVGLPVDMPKAWFVALATLAKSATPERVKKNATSDHVAIPPVHEVLKK